MQLRSGKSLPPAPPKRVTRRKSRPFRLLDLPTELRLMIYGYVFGYENAHWMMGFDNSWDNGFTLALGRPQDTYGTKHNVYLHKHRSGLFQTCRQVSQGSLLIFYNQTRLDILFCHDYLERFRSPYKLPVVYGTPETGRDILIRVILQRVKHIRFNINSERNNYFHLWQMNDLRSLLDYGAWLKSLQFFVKGSIRFTERDNWYTLDGWPDATLDFVSYRGNAILVPCDYRNSDLSDEDITELKKGIRESKITYSIEVYRERDLPNDKRQPWLDVDP